jgi:hypothetical protein
MAELRMKRTQVFDTVIELGVHQLWSLGTKESLKENAS